MLRNIIVSLFIIAMITTASSIASAQKKTEAKALRHVVLFKFKDTSRPDDIKKVEEAFAGSRR